MRETLERFLLRWGQEVRVERRGEVPCAARLSLQPVFRKRQEGTLQPTPIGWADQRRWTCFAAVELRRGDLVRWGENCLRLLDAAPVHLGEEVLYWCGSAAPEQVPEEKEADG